MASFANQTFHLGGGEDALGVDPNREGYPAGQAVGAIDQLVGAAELVRRFMDEAEATLARTSTLAGR
jgi:hypothetical protein